MEQTLVKAPYLVNARKRPAAQREIASAISEARAKARV